jgi:hypothetical protein
VTEILYALAMITKSGVHVSKIIVGKAKDEKSFNMPKADCTGPKSQA